MPTPLLILHLSDAHIGNPKYQLDSFEVFDTVFSDLKKYRTEFGRPPDLIVFNGDLAFGQLPHAPLSDQFKQAKAWLDRMYEAVESDATASPILFVPGNHDLDRGVIGPDQTSWIANLKNPDDLYHEMQSNSVSWKRFLERQALWAAFVESYPSGAFKLDKNLNICAGALPQSNPSVGVVALNTAWASYDENENGKLWLGKFQLQRARELTKGHDFRIVATHHPVDWLHHIEKPKTEKKIQSDFHLHLHGHVHDQWFVASEGHLRVQAGACYAGSAKANGYSWMEIDFTSREARLYLRSYTDEGQSGWIPNVLLDKTDNNGIGIVKALFLGKGGALSPIVPVAPPPKPAAQKPAKKAANSKNVNFEPPSVSTLKDLDAYIRILEEHFSFRWEPGDHDHKRKPIVYWPIKLRKPTVIHAVQAYAAAGLQKMGAKVVLCLDDHGDIEYTKAAFSNRVRKWFENAAGDYGALDVRTFKGMVTAERYQEVWDFLQRWYSDEKYRIKDILAVSKLWTVESDINTFSNLLIKTPKRLLTAPMVWTCLFMLLEENPDASLLTLGGFDEQALWHAWRDCLKQPCPVGHVYIPQLLRPNGSNNETPLHMAQPENNLYWDSKDDIKSALQDARAEDAWASPGRLIPWLSSGGVGLPRYLNGLDVALPVQSNFITTLDTLAKINSSSLVSALTAEAARYMF